MRAILDIALNQVRIQLSERGVLITTVVMPVVMMIFIGIFTGQANWSTPRLDVVRATEGESDPLAVQFVDILRANGQKEAAPGQMTYRVCDLSAPERLDAACERETLPARAQDMAAEARRRVDSGDSYGAVFLPAGFGPSLRAGEPVTVDVYTRGGDANAAQVVQRFVDAVNTRVGGAVLAAQAAAEKAGAQDDPAFFDRVYTLADATWSAEPVAIEQRYSTLTGGQEGTGFGQSAPGIGAQFVMIISLTLAQIFISDRRNGTLQRLMVMPISRAQILAGKLLGQYLMGLLTYGLMIGAGTLLGVRWGDPLGVLAIVLLYTLAVTAMGLAFSTLVRTSGQAQGVGLLVPMVMAPLGGAWWAANLMPQTMQTIGRIISPIAWSQGAFNQMVFYGATLPDLLPNIAVLLLFTAVFFAFGLARFRLE